MKRLRSLTGQIINRILSLLGLHLTRLSKVDHSSLPNWARALTFPPGHPLPSILSSHPNYQGNLAELASVISSKYPGASLIDIGGNIGDTVALLRNSSMLPIISVEGDPLFFSYLQRNTAAMSNIAIYNAFLGDPMDDRAEWYQALRQGGTLALVSDQLGNIPIQSFDRLWRTAFGSCNFKLFKVDADGFDTKILRGSISAISQNRPVLYFEYDPDLLRRSDEHYSECIVGLCRMGYKYCIIYDQLGRKLLWSPTDPIDRIAQVDLYLRGRRGLLSYVDICLLTESDVTIYRELTGCG